MLLFRFVEENHFQATFETTNIYIFTITFSSPDDVSCTFSACFGNICDRRAAVLMGVSGLNFFMIRNEKKHLQSDNG